jgi:hypothetical protein
METLMVGVGIMAVSGWKELKTAAGWWVLGVVIGGLSSDAAGALVGLWPLLLAASLGGALAALAAASGKRAHADATRLGTHSIMKT